MTPRQLKKHVGAQRRDILALIRKFGEERSADLKLAGNPGGAAAIKAMTRDLQTQVKARYQLDE